jgi:thiamine-monophosphate kinase
MHSHDLSALLRFYMITDDNAPSLSPIEQVRIGLRGGATLIQYRNKTFNSSDFGEAKEIRDLCRTQGVPFIINDHIVLAKAVGADGVHVGQKDDAPSCARRVLGPGAIIGVSASTPAELRRCDLSACDYVGTGPVFATGTKTDAKPVIGLKGLSRLVSLSGRPVVAIGGIDANRAPGCFAAGAAGVAVISAVSRAADPLTEAVALAAACGTDPRPRLLTPWTDEFALIDALLSSAGPCTRAPSVSTPAGDDTCRLTALNAPVVTTDTQREGVHFQRGWHPWNAVGEKAVEVTFSDLAAAYARPAALFVNLGLPKDMTVQAAQAIYKGIGIALNRHGAGLGGGNVSRAEAVTLDLMGIGEGMAELSPSRSAARPGDILGATGPLGVARCGLIALRRRDLSWGWQIDRFRFPRARFDAAAILADHKIGCVMDISDGLYGDASHIARASGITIDLDPAEAARHPRLRAFCHSHGLDPEALVIQGGEDYELLFTCPERRFDSLRSKIPGLIRVGRCRRDMGRPLSTPPPDGLASFQHGAS